MCGRLHSLCSHVLTMTSRSAFASQSQATAAYSARGPRGEASIVVPITRVTADGQGTLPTRAWPRFRSS